MTRKTGNAPKRMESLAKAEGVTAVTGVTGGLDESLTRARRVGGRSDARARTRSCISGNSGNTGNSSENTLAGERETAVTGAPGATGNTGNSGNALTDRASLNAALQVPVQHLAWLPARLTFRFLAADGAEVVWTTHPGVYGALRGSQAGAAPRAVAFSPKEFEAAVAAGESGVAVGREFASWVAQKRAAPEWRLGTEEALRWAPRARVAGFGWWPGSEWCDGHDATPERGWTVAFACAVFGLTPVSVEVHPAEAMPESPTTSEAAS